MKITGKERRNKILELLGESDRPLSGSELAEKLSVSRQAIVNDVALLRTSHPELISTSSGYVLMKSSKCSRIFKVNHTDEQTYDELTGITDLGGTIVDVFIEHKVYGTICAPLNISSRRDVVNFIKDLQSGVSSPLKNITKGYHYHTVEAANEEILDEIGQMLVDKGYLIEASDMAVNYSPKSYSK